jgi:hypothetical protein
MTFTEEKTYSKQHIIRSIHSSSHHYRYNHYYIIFFLSSSRAAYSAIVFQAREQNNLRVNIYINLIERGKTIFDHFSAVVDFL